MALHGLEHLLVLTDDLEATRAFWCDAVGLEVGERPPLPFPGYWLYAGATACVHLAERAAYEAHAATLGLPATAGPVDHVAFAASDHDALAARLAAAGVEAVANEIPTAAIRQLFATDPNGVRAELNVHTYDRAMALFPESHRDLLDGQLATLATIDDRGLPQLTEVWFLFEGEELRLSLNTTRWKTRNLLQRDACSVLLLDVANPARYLEVRGHARIEPDDDYVLADRVGAKYGADLRAIDRPGETRVAVTVEPVRVYAVDMSRR